MGVNGRRLLPTTQHFDPHPGFCRGRLSPSPFRGEGNTFCGRRIGQTPVRPPAEPGVCHCDTYTVSLEL